MKRREALKAMALAAASIGVLGALPARKRFDFTRLAREPRTQEYTALVNARGELRWHPGRPPSLPYGWAILGYVTVTWPQGVARFEAVPA